MDDIIFQYKIDDIGLKPFDRNDIINSNYRYWFDDPEVSKYNSHGRFPMLDREIDELFDSIGNRRAVVWAIYIMDEKSKRTYHVGNVALQKIDVINRSAELAIIIGEKKCWGRGIATKACYIVLNHAFKKLLLHRVYAGTSEDNEMMKKVLIKIGMSYEGHSQDAILEESGWKTVKNYRILHNSREG